MSGRRVGKGASRSAGSVSSSIPMVSFVTLRQEAIEQKRARAERASFGKGAASLLGSPPAEPSVDRARRLRHLREIARLDYLRELRRLGGSLTQIELARGLGVSQPAVSDSLKTAARLPEPRAGFSGADPYEIAQRYVAGDLNRDQLIDELARWDYRPGAPTDGYDWTTGDEGEWEETVGRAFDEGLLDDETYTAIQQRARSLRATS